MSRLSLVVSKSKSAPVPPGARLAPAWRRWVESVNRRWPIALPGTVPGRVPITRLMAVVFADMAGYSRLFALDDTGTVARLRMIHNELIEPAIRHHHGRLVQTGGDSMLIIFESVAQAVKCAVTIQSEIAINADYWPIDQKMRFRIGVDLGDIIMDGMNFHGDGVIVASRLQAVCPPGGVCVSRAVHERGGARLGLATEALGPLALKNVGRPVEAFVMWPRPREAMELLV
jgi:class 3 adenylate cyclase